MKKIIFLLTLLALGNTGFAQEIDFNIDTFLKNSELSSVAGPVADFRKLFVSEDLLLKSKSENSCIFGMQQLNMKVKLIPVDKGMRISELLPLIGFPNWLIKGPKIEIITDDMILQSPHYRFTPSKQNQVKVFLDTIVTPGDVVYIPSRN